MDNAIRKFKALDQLYFYDKLNETFLWFSELSEIRQMALIDFCSIVGLKKFLEFDRLISAFENEDYDGVVREILKSNLHKKHAHNLAEIMSIGEL